MRHLPYHLIYHDDYDLNLGAHVFPTQKYRWIREKLLREQFAALEDFRAPEPAAVEDVLLVHEAGGVRRLSTGTLSYHDILGVEVASALRIFESYAMAVCR